jgi:outer membrane usher protein
VFALQSLGGERERSVGVFVTRSLGARTTASANWNRQRSDSAGGFQLQQSLPPGPGLGYRVAANGGARPREEAALFVRNEVGSYAVEAARVHGTAAQRLSASGGVALLGGRLHLARRLNDSFAVVKVGDYAAVPVYVDNQLVARTGDDGSALVPSLRPYQRNSISIDQGALPLDARVGALRMPLTLARRSGRVVAFPVGATRGALLRITLEDGAPLPAGAVVRIRGHAEAFPVALRGEAYVTGLARDNELEVSWKGRRCLLAVTLPDDGGPLPVLGPFVCQGVTP